MRFYEMLSEYYDMIFAPTDTEIGFLKGYAGPSGSRVLDCACGTGQYAIELYRLGYTDIEAVDMDSDMINKARQKSSAINFIAGDMLDIDKYYKNKFDMIFCIGNSLAHLGGPDEIRQYMDKTFGLLDKGGRSVIQTINFDRIITQARTSLPAIIKNGITFERNYSIEGRRVIFTGIIKKGREIYSSSSALYGMTSEELKSMFLETGYVNIEIFGSFSKDVYDKVSSYSTVICAESC